MQQIDCVSVCSWLTFQTDHKLGSTRNQNQNQLPFIWAAPTALFLFTYLYFSKVNYLHLLAFILFSVGTHTKSGHKLNSHRACAFLMVLSKRVPRTCLDLQLPPPSLPAARESRASTIYYISAVPITMIYLSPVCRARDRACAVQVFRCREGGEVLVQGIACFV